MRTYYVFQGQNSPGLRAFTDTPEGEKLPAEDGPWTLVQKISPDEDWDLSISRFLAVVAAGIMENGFYIYGPINRPDSSKSIIESDRVEGTAVFDREIRAINRPFGPNVRASAAPRFLIDGLLRVHQRRACEEQSDSQDREKSLH